MGSEECRFLVLFSKLSLFCVLDFVFCVLDFEIFGLAQNIFLIEIFEITKACNFFDQTN